MPLLRGYLSAVGALARPVRAVSPLVFTVAGAAVALGGLLLAAAHPWAAFAAVVLATVCDALDGAVAVLAKRTSRSGAVADKIADRIADTAFALVIWRCGAPFGLAVAAAALALVLEMVRELRGGRLRARITVAERPTRVICVLLACASAAVATSSRPVTACAVVWVAATLVGVGQLARTDPGPR